MYVFHVGAYHQSSVLMFLGRVLEGLEATDSSSVMWALKIVLSQGGWKVA